MKKIFSILFLTLLLLNIMGFYGVFMGLQYKNTRDVTLRLNAEDYSEGETLVIKVPIAIPYMSSTSFERVTGEIEYKGEFYNLLKQRLSNDTLIVVCVKNRERKQIEQALADYVKTFTDKTNASSGRQSKVVPSFIKDFLPTNISIESLVAGWSAPLLYAALEKELPCQYPSVISPPPWA